MDTGPSDATASVLLCITPSPAIDRTAHVGRISHGDVLRPTELMVLPGGKGVNAARAAARLGGNVVTSGIAGGHAGRWLVAALEQEGLHPRFSTAAAESRTAYVTVDGAGDSILVYERASPASSDEFDSFLRLLEDELLPGCSRAIVAGTVPAGVDPASHGHIVEVCRRAGRPLLVDASGAGLLATLEQRPDLVKIGLVEAVEAGLADETASAVDAAAALAERGAAVAVVTDGAREVGAADASTTWRAEVPQVDPVNAVGSGDSFNAAMSLALMEEATMEVALARGVAAGSANALALGAGMLDADLVSELEKRVEVSTMRR